MKIVWVKVEWIFVLKKSRWSWNWMNICVERKYSLSWNWMNICVEWKYMALKLNDYYLLNININPWMKILCFWILLQTANHILKGLKTLWDLPDKRELWTAGTSTFKPVASFCTLQIYHWVRMSSRMVLLRSFIVSLIRNFQYVFREIFKNSSKSRAFSKEIFNFSDPPRFKIEKKIVEIETRCQKKKTLMGG